MYACSASDIQSHAGMAVLGGEFDKSLPALRGQMRRRAFLEFALPVAVIEATNDIMERCCPWSMIGLNLHADTLHEGGSGGKERASFLVWIVGLCESDARMVAHLAGMSLRRYTNRLGPGRSIPRNPARGR